MPTTNPMHAHLDCASQPQPPSSPLTAVVMKALRLPMGRGNIQGEVPRATPPPAWGVPQVLKIAVSYSWFLGYRASSDNAPVFPSRAQDGYITCIAIQCS